MREIIIYSVVAVSALALMGYSVHMLLGGLVEENTEYSIMAIVIGLGIVAISYMVWDVINLRKKSTY